MPETAPGPGEVVFSARDPMNPEAALARVGLEGRMAPFPSRLSGGELGG